MPIRHLEFSIVVVASDCNPTILNPDFLGRQAIVPEDWGWKLAGPPITTPPFATVSYDSGVTVSVEPNKFQVVDRLADKTFETSKIPDIARKYIQVLPHVRYTAVGHNFRSFVERADAESLLKERFLKPGPWDSDAHRLEGISLKFVYLLQGGRVIFSLDGATMTDRSGDQPKELHGILMHANFHRDCQGYPSDKQVVEHLQSLKKDWEHYQTLLSDIVGSDDEA